MAPHPSPGSTNGSTAETTERVVTTAHRTHGRRDHRDRTAERAAEDGGVHACPLCDFTDATRDEVYGHLLTSHRKSAISAALVEADPTAVE